MTDFENVVFSRLGQFGRFQALILAVCKAADFAASSVMTLMAVSGGGSQWWTNVAKLNTTTNQSEVYRKYQHCPSRAGETIIFTEEYKTVVSEWKLVCKDDWVPNTITTIQMAGVLLGAFVVAQLGDLIGRKKSFYGAFGLMMLLTFASSFSTSWQMFAVFRFFIGMTLGGHLVVAYTLPIEYIGTKWRTVGGSCPSWSIGVAALGLVSWVVKDWRHLSMITGGMGVPILLTWWFVPESCRWLLSKGRFDEADKVLGRMAKINGKDKPDISRLKDIVSEERQQDMKKRRYTFIDLFTHWSALRPLLLCGFMFFSVVLGYYAFTLGVSELSGNRHINLFLSGVVEAFSVVAVIFISMLLKRRKTTMTLFLLGGLSSLGITVAYFTVKRELFSQIQNVLALGAKFFLSGAFVCIYLLVAEVFPTVIRNLGIGAVSTIGRFGGLISPQILYLHKVNAALPYVICGSLLFVSGLLCLCLKETYGEPLPNELEEDNKKRQEPVTLMTMGHINGGVEA